MFLYSDVNRNSSDSDPLCYWFDVCEGDIANVKSYKRGLESEETRIITDVALVLHIIKTWQVKLKYILSLWPVDLMHTHIMSIDCDDSKNYQMLSYSYMCVLLIVYTYLSTIINKCIVVGNSEQIQHLLYQNF